MLAAIAGFKWRQQSAVARPDGRKGARDKPGHDMPINRLIRTKSAFRELHGVGGVRRGGYPQ
jgi:hypothetical protein